MGRPPLFKTPEELQERIDDYFENGVPEKTLYSNGVPYRVRVPSISGLSIYVGCADRHTFYDYEKIPEFFHTIKNARARITQYYEENTQIGSAAGAIFMLKNLGYTDNQNINMTAQVVQMSKISRDGQELNFNIGEETNDA